MPPRAFRGMASTVDEARRLGWGLCSGDFQGNKYQVSKPDRASMFLKHDAAAVVLAESVPIVEFACRDSFIPISTSDARVNNLFAV